MSAVRLEQVVKHYGKHPALHALSLEFQDRQFTVLVGPSGCGKSTLLRLVAGLETPTAGQVFLGERCVNGVPPWRRNVAMVFQSYALYPHLTVRENLAFPLRAQRWRREQIDARVREAAGRLEITEFLDRFPRQLSGGQMQRVAIGRAIVRSPDVFLMDEPLSNLDALLRVDMRAEIKRLHREVGTTTIYVTHDQEEALTLAEVLVVLRDGRVEQVGTPQQVYDRPRTVFVASFLGNPPANLLAGRYHLPENAVFGDGFQLRLGARPSGDGSNRDLWVAIRPESIQMLNEPAGGPLVASGQIDLVESLGRQALVTVLVGDCRLKAFAPIEGAPTVGQQVWLHATPDSCLLFDRHAGIAVGKQQ
jgi:ABC-type sugar transport system ATPase subunit